MKQIIDNKVKTNKIQMKELKRKMSVEVVI